MKTTLRLLGAAVLCFALNPFTTASAQDACRGLAPSTGLAPTECLQKVSPVENIDRSGPADDAFGFDAVNDFVAPEYVRFAQNAPGAVAPVGPTTAPSFINAGDFAGDDLSIWYALDFAGNAYEVDPATGAETLLGVMSGPPAWGDMAWDNDSGQFFAIESNCSTYTDLYTVDFNTLTSTLVGRGTTATCGVGLAIDNAGNGYIHDIVADQLFSVNLATGATTAIGATGFPANFAQSMDFDKQDGTLYLYAFNDVAFAAELYIMNTLTGAGTLVGAITGAAATREITAGSSETQKPGGDPFQISATPPTQTVAAGGQASFQVTVTNKTNNTQSGVLCYKAGPLAPVQVVSGSLNPQQTRTVPVNINVPGSTPANTYNVQFRIGPNCSTIVASTTVQVTVTNPGIEADAPLADWTLTETVVWPTEAAARTSEIGAYPNPFVDRTEIAYTLEEGAQVQLTVYDVLGREVAVLTDEVLEAGTHTATFEARGLATGTYIYRLVAGNEVQSGRITLMK